MILSTYFVTSGLMMSDFGEIEKWWDNYSERGGMDNSQRENWLCVQGQFSSHSVTEASNFMPGSHTAVELFVEFFSSSFFFPLFFQGLLCQVPLHF